MPAACPRYAVLLAGLKNRVARQQTGHRTEYERRAHREDSTSDWHQYTGTAATSKPARLHAKVDSYPFLAELEKRPFSGISVHQARLPLAGSDYFIPGTTGKAAYHSIASACIAARRAVGSPGSCSHEFEWPAGFG